MASPNSGLTSSFSFGSGSVSSMDWEGEIESSESLPSLSNSQEVNEAIGNVAKNHFSGEKSVQKAQKQRKKQLARKLDKMETSSPKRRKIVTALNLSGDVGPLSKVKAYHPNALKGVLDIFSKESSSEDVQRLALAYQGFAFRSYLHTQKSKPPGGLYLIRPSTSREGVAVVACADKALAKVRMFRVEYLKLVGEWHTRICVTKLEQRNYVASSIAHLKQKISAGFEGGICTITMNSLVTAKGLVTHAGSSQSTSFQAVFLKQEKLWKASVLVPTKMLKLFRNKSIVALTHTVAQQLFGLTQLSPVPPMSADVEVQFVQYWKKMTQTTTTTTSQGTGLQNTL